MLHLLFLLIWKVNGRLIFIHVNSSEVQLIDDDLLFCNRLAIVWVEMNRQSIYHQ